MAIVIVETTTRALVIVNPQMRDGKPILPEGVECEVVELSDADAALVGQTNARYSVDLRGALVVAPVALVAEVDPDAELVAAITAATTLTALKLALLGSRGGRVKARPAA